MKLESMILTTLFLHNLEVTPQFSLYLKNYINLFDYKLMGQSTVML